jgi:hypothetical protein
MIADHDGNQRWTSGLYAGAKLRSVPDPYLRFAARRPGRLAEIAKAELSRRLQSVTTTKTKNGQIQ